MSDSTERSNWLDSAKGIGIVLVVYGHLLASAVHAGVPISPRFFNTSDSVLYSFHMPLFFFLAGLLVEHSYARRGVRHFVVDKIIYLGYPYLVWSILQTGIECIATRHSVHHVTFRDVLLLPIYPHEQFWFLYALLWCYLVYALCRQSARWGRLLMLLAAGALFAYPIRSEAFAVHDFSLQFVFFVAGALGSSRLFDASRGKYDFLWAILPAVSFLAGALTTFLRWLPPMRLTEDYGHHPFLLLGLATLGIAAVVGVARVGAASVVGRVASTIGRDSMPIFLAHMLVGVPVRMLLMKVGLESPWLVIPLSVLLAVVVPIWIYRAAFGRGLRYLFTWSPVRPQAI